MAKKLTKKMFIEKSIKNHEDRFDYSLVPINVCYNEKVKITDKKTGTSFTQIAGEHMNGVLPRFIRREEKMLDNETFVKRCNEVHGGFYDYSLVKYDGMHKKITIIDPEYGPFTQKAQNHLLGQGHPKRRAQKIANKLKKNKEWFIKRANEIHGDKYDYTFVEYKNVSTKVKIYCKKHKYFFCQTPNDHLNGKRGCPKCGGTIRISNDEFIDMAKSIWGDIYSYEKTNYINMHTEVTITCKKHGDFSIKPVWFIRHTIGCQLCSKENKRSVEEQIIANVIIKHFNGNIIKNCYSVIKNPTTNKALELDIYIPDLKIAFEFNGSFWHSIEFNQENEQKHLNKTKLCEEKGIRLFHVWEKDLMERRNEVEDKIRRIFDTKNLKIPTDKIVEIDRSWPEFDKDEMQFCGYELIEEQEPNSFEYKDKYTLFDCGKLIYKKVE